MLAQDVDNGGKAVCLKCGVKFSGKDAAAQTGTGGNHIKMCHPASATARRLRDKEEAFFKKNSMVSVAQHHEVPDEAKPAAAAATLITGFRGFQVGAVAHVLVGWWAAYIERGLTCDRGLLWLAAGASLTG